MPLEERKCSRKKKMKEETLEIFGHYLGAPLPFVDIEVKGMLVHFLVDTGCVISAITREQLAVLGYEESELERGLTKLPQLGYLWLDYKVNSVEGGMIFAVLDDSANLLGRDFLIGHCCVIDLNRGRLTLRDEFQFQVWEPLKTTVSIEGRNVDMEVDTGTESILSGSLGLARALDLPLEPVKGMSVLGVGFRGAVPYQARNVCARAFGREMRNAYYIVDPKETPEGQQVPLLGAPFFVGLEIHLRRDGSMEVKFPAGRPRWKGITDPDGLGEEGGAAGHQKEPQETDEELPAACYNGAF